jgi:hypothetical protein
VSAGASELRCVGGGSLVGAEVRRCMQGHLGGRLGRNARVEAGARRTGGGRGTVGGRAGGGWGAVGRCDGGRGAACGRRSGHGGRCASASQI